MKTLPYRKSKQETRMSVERKREERMENAETKKESLFL
jgi:hypothetical protein